MSEIKLQLVFLTGNEKKHTITVDRPKNPADALAVKEAMDTILASNVINTSHGALASIEGAYMITKDTQPVSL
jgi:Protein of unknown function (DUF2922)